MRRLWVALGLSMVVSVSVGACAPYAGTRVGASFVVRTAPPPPRYEVIVASPGPRHVWVPGFWEWRPRVADYAWVPGYWARAPRPGAVWVPPRYEPRGRGYVYFAGHWR